MREPRFCRIFSHNTLGILPHLFLRGNANGILPRPFFLGSILPHLNIGRDDKSLWLWQRTPFVAMLHGRGPTGRGRAEARFIERDRPSEEPKSIGYPIYG